MIEPRIEQRIHEQLDELEANEDIEILYACESGSRAWGFPSKDSDFDVRFVYVRERDWYLRVDHESQRDVVELPIDKVLDISGWDLKKALKLLRKSNPALIEWFHSPIAYRENEIFGKEFRSLIKSHYSPRSCFYHYSHMAKSNYREFLDRDAIRTKKYFYVLRPILAMNWIDRDLGVVPMEFEVLANAILEPGDLLDAISDLLREKRKGFETARGPRIEVISAYIESELERFEGMAEEISLAETDFSILNVFFVKVLDGKYIAD